MATSGRRNARNLHNITKKKKKIVDSGSAVYPIRELLPDRSIRPKTKERRGREKKPPHAFRADAARQREASPSGEKVQLRARQKESGRKGGKQIARAWCSKSTQIEKVNGAWPGQDSEGGTFNQDLT